MARRKNARNRGRRSKLQKEINAIHYRAAQRKRHEKEEAARNPHIYTGSVKFTPFWYRYAQKDNEKSGRIGF